jgi:hypothetical protein
MVAANRLQPALWQCKNGKKSFFGPNFARIDKSTLNGRNMSRFILNN